MMKLLGYRLLFLDYQSTAIVLKIHRLSEADKILHLYSPTHGPIRAVAKSAFKANSKLVAKTQVFNVCDFLFASGRNLDIVKEAKLNQSFKYINQNYDALNFAAFFIDAIDHIAVNDDHYREPFDFLVNCLERINLAATEDLIKISTEELWNLIGILGYKPDLDTCSITHRARSAAHIPQYFDLENGSVTSENGYQQVLANDPYQDRIRKLAPGVFNILYSLEQKQELEEDREKLSKSFKLLYKHLEYHLHKELKSWKLLEPLLVQEPVLLQA